MLCYENTHIRTRVHTYAQMKQNIAHALMIIVKTYVILFTYVSLFDHITSYKVSWEDNAYETKCI